MEERVNLFIKSKENPQSINHFVAGDSGGGRGGGDRNCYKCGESGHMARECPKNEGGGERGMTLGTAVYIHFL